MALKFKINPATKRKYLTLTGEQIKEFMAKGKTHTDYDGVRYEVVSNSKGWPILSGNFEYLKADESQFNPDEVRITFVGDIDYLESGIPPYKG